MQFGDSIYDLVMVTVSVINKSVLLIAIYAFNNKKEVRRIE